jgi:3-(3-hydroxy-phenyl)propionate hydroxylase
MLASRYDGQPGTTYLIRPDQYVAGRWRSFDAAELKLALSRAVAC